MKNQRSKLWVVVGALFTVLFSHSLHSGGGAKKPIQLPISVGGAAAASPRTEKKITQFTGLGILPFSVVFDKDGKPEPVLLLRKKRSENVWTLFGEPSVPKQEQSRLPKALAYFGDQTMGLFGENFETKDPIEFNGGRYPVWMTTISYIPAGILTLSRWWLLKQFTMQVGTEVAGLSPRTVDFFSLTKMGDTIGYEWVKVADLLRGESYIQNLSGSKTLNLDSRLLSGVKANVEKISIYVENLKLNIPNIESAQSKLPETQSYMPALASLSKDKMQKEAKSKQRIGFSVPQDIEGVIAGNIVPSPLYELFYEGACRLPFVCDQLLRGFSPAAIAQAQKIASDRQRAITQSALLYFARLSGNFKQSKPKLYAEIVKFLTQDAFVARVLELNAQDPDQNTVEKIAPQVFKELVIDAQRQAFRIVAQEYFDKSEDLKTLFGDRNKTFKGIDVKDQAFIVNYILNNFVDRFADHLVKNPGQIDNLGKAAQIPYRALRIAAEGLVKNQTKRAELEAEWEAARRAATVARATFLFANRAEIDRFVDNARGNIPRAIQDARAGAGPAQETPKAARERIVAAVVGNLLGQVDSRFQFAVREKIKNAVQEEYDRQQGLEAEREKAAAVETKRKEEAATKIQAGVRGMRARRQAAGAREEVARGAVAGLAQAIEVGPDTNIDAALGQLRERLAAAHPQVPVDKIAALVATQKDDLEARRAAAVEEKKREEAATRIQVGVRGMRARRQAAGAREEAARGAVAGLAQAIEVGPDTNIDAALGQLRERLAAAHPQVPVDKIAALVATQKDDLEARKAAAVEAKRREEAATRIQAGVRGMRARRQAAGAREEAARDAVAGLAQAIEVGPDTNIDAALGQLRERLAAAHPQVPVDKIAALVATQKDDLEARRAAAVEEKKREEAATRIQAGVRGMQARRQAAGVREEAARGAVAGLAQAIEVGPDTNIDAALGQLRERLAAAHPQVPVDKIAALVATQKDDLEARRAAAVAVQTREAEEAAAEIARQLAGAGREEGAREAARAALVARRQAEQAAARRVTGEVAERERAQAQAREEAEAQVRRREEESARQREAEAARVAQLQKELEDVSRALDDARSALAQSEKKSQAVEKANKKLRSALQRSEEGNALLVAANKKAFTEQSKAERLRDELQAKLTSETMEAAQLQAILNQKTGELEAARREMTAAQEAAQRAQEESAAAQERVRNATAEQLGAARAEAERKIEAAQVAQREQNGAVKRLQDTEADLHKKLAEQARKQKEIEAAKRGLERQNEVSAQKQAETERNVAQLQAQLAERDRVVAAARAEVEARAAEAQRARQEAEAIAARAAQEVADVQRAAEATEGRYGQSLRAMVAAIESLRQDLQRAHAAAQRAQADRDRAAQAAAQERAQLEAQMRAQQEAARVAAQEARRRDEATRAELERTQRMAAQAQQRALEAQQNAQQARLAAQRAAAADRARLEAEAQRLRQEAQQAEIDARRRRELAQAAINAAQRRAAQAAQRVREQQQQAEQNRIRAAQAAAQERARLAADARRRQEQARDAGVDARRRLDEARRALELAQGRSEQLAQELERERLARRPMPVPGFAPAPQAAAPVGPKVCRCPRAKKRKQVTCKKCRKGFVAKCGTCKAKRNAACYCVKRPKQVKRKPNVRRPNLLKKRK